MKDKGLVQIFVLQGQFTPPRGPTLTRKLSQGWDSAGCRADAQPVDRLAAVMRKTYLVSKNIGHSEYSSVRSKRTFSDHTKIGLLILKQMVRKSYRDFVDMLPSLTGVLKEAGIVSMPDPSTLWKFSSILDPEFLEAILQNIEGMVCREEMILVVDSTGFSL